MYFFVDPEVFNPLPKSFHLLEVKSLQQLRRLLTFREKYFPEIPSRWILIKFSLKMLQNSLVIHEQNITSSKKPCYELKLFRFFTNLSTFEAKKTEKRMERKNQYLEKFFMMLGWFGLIFLTAREKVLI